MLFFRIFRNLLFAFWILMLIFLIATFVFIGPPSFTTDIENITISFTTWIDFDDSFFIRRMHLWSGSMRIWSNFDDLSHEKINKEFKSVLCHDTHAYVLLIPLKALQLLPTSTKFPLTKNHSRCRAKDFFRVYLQFQ